MVPLHDVEPVVGALGRGDGLRPDPEGRVRLGGAGLLEDLVHERAQAAQVHPTEAGVLPDHVEGAVVPVVAEDLPAVALVRADAVAAVERVALEPVGVGERADFPDAVPLVELAPRVVQVVGERHPRAGSVHVVVGGEVRPNVVRLGRDLRDSEVVEPRRQVEALDDLARERRVVEAGRVVRVRHLGAGDVAAELVQDREVALVAVLGRLLLDAAGIGLVRERTDVLVGVALRVEAVPVLDELVREAAGVERQLVELAVALEAHGVVERHEAAGHPEHLEGERLADARRVGPFGDERGLADLDVRAVERVGARKRLALVEAKAVRLLVPARGRVAAQVDAHVVVVEAGLAVVDAAARAVGDERLVLLVAVDVHLREVVRGIDEEVERLQTGGDLFRRRLDDRAVVLVGVVRIAEGRRAPHAALGVLDDRRPAHQMPGGGKRGGGDRVRVELAGALRVVGAERHRRGVRDLGAEVRAVDEAHRDDRVARQVGERVHGERDGVVLAVRRLRERAPVGKVVLHAVERAGVRAVGDGVRQVVRRERRRRGDDVAHRRGGGRDHEFVEHVRLDRDDRGEIARAGRLGGRLHDPGERMRAGADGNVRAGRDVGPVQHERDGRRGVGRSFGGKAEGRRAEGQVERRGVRDRLGAVPRGERGDFGRGQRAGEGRRADLDAVEREIGVGGRRGGRPRHLGLGVDHRGAVEVDRVARVRGAAEDDRDVVPRAVEEPAGGGDHGRTAAVRDERAGRIEPEGNRARADGVGAARVEERDVRAGLGRGVGRGEEPERDRDLGCGRERVRGVGADEPVRGS